MANPLYVAFNLPPPRGPTPLSVHHARRLMFPNFMIAEDPVQSLRDWMDRLFFVRLSERTVIQIKFTMAFICVLEVVVTAILVGRLYDRSFWVFRFARKANGTLIIPNALIDFSLFAGIFGYFLIALNFLVLDWFQEKKHHPGDWPLWMGTTWIFVAVAAHFAGMGTHFARPQSTSDAKAPGRLGRTIGRPLFVNLFTLLAPLTWSLAIVTVAGVSNTKWKSVLHDYYSWHSRYEHAPAMTRDMLMEANWLWERLVDVYLVLGVCYLIWTVWAFQLWVQYSIAAGRLLYVIGKQIQRFRKQEADAKSRQTMRLKNKAEAGPLRLVTFKSTPSLPAAATQPPSTPEKPSGNGAAEVGSAVPLSAEAPFSGSTCSIDRDETSSSKGHGSESVPPTPGSSKTLLAVPTEINHPAKASNKPVFADDSADELSDDDEGDDELSDDEQRRRQLFTNAEIEADDPTATFFPPVKPSRIIAHKQLVQKQPRAKSLSNKSGHLISIFRHVLLQFVAIGPAIIILVGWTAWNTVALPSCAERNTLTEIVGHGLLWVDWVCCVAGCMTLVGIAQRTYEPIFTMNLGTTNGSGDEAGSKRRKRKSRARPAGNASTAQNVTTWFESQTLNHQQANSVATSAADTTTPSRGILSTSATTKNLLPTIPQSEDGEGAEPTTSKSSTMALRPLSLGTVEKLPPTITRPRNGKKTSHTLATPRLGSGGTFSDTMAGQPVGIGKATSGIFMQRTIETAYEVTEPHLTNPLPGDMPMPTGILEATKYGHDRVQSDDSISSPMGPAAADSHVDFFSATSKKAVAGPLAGRAPVVPLGTLSSLIGMPGGAGGRAAEDTSDDGEDDYGEPEKASKPPGSYGSAPAYI